MSGEDLKGKIALVTGSSRGIGRAIARGLAMHGARIAINYSTSESEAKKLKDSIGKAEIFRADISSRDEVKRMFDEIHDSMGAVDILVNNAGIMDLMNFEDFDEDRVKRMMDTNVMGCIYNSIEAIKDMRSSGSGTIVNIASNAGIGTAAPGTTYYALTKAAVIMLTKRLAFDLRNTQIRANAIAPGWVESDMTLSGKSEEASDAMKEYFRERTTLGMTGKPEYIADAVYFLSSDASRYMNGQIIVMDGGRIDNLTHSV